MKKYIVIPATLAFVIFGCFTATPGEIPKGSWQYSLVMNDVEIGNATVTSDITEGNYVTRTGMTMRAGEVTNTSDETLIETMEFKPVMLEVRNRIAQGTSVQETKTVARFEGKTVHLESNGRKTTVVLKKPFVLPGNYFAAELIKNKYRAGTVVKAYIYDPTIEVDEPVLLTMTMRGTKTVRIGKTEKRLLHLEQSIEGVKSIDAYIDDQGVMHKAVIRMMNNVFELVLKQ